MTCLFKQCTQTNDFSNSISGLPSRTSVGAVWQLNFLHRDKDEAIVQLSVH